MTYNPGEHQEVFQFTCVPPNSYHYISDGSTAGGDETNFWSSSPTRSGSPSPTVTHSNHMNDYQIFAPTNCQRYNPSYRNGYSTLSGPELAPLHTHIPGSYVRVVKRRSTANKKERRRTQSINNAYADLRACIPMVPVDTKLSKIKTLRLATSYISYLTRALESDDPACGFKAELGSSSRKTCHSNNNPGTPLQVNDCTTGQISPKSDCSEDVVRKAKGRTGWPQHVWALELKQEQSL